jgi:hypothetical protein
LIILARYSVLQPVAALLGLGSGDIAEESVTVIVGHDEDPLSLVRCADFRRAENACRCFVTHSFQLAEDMEQNWGSCWISPTISIELCGEDSFNIFKENNGRSASSNAVQNVGEEVAGIFISVPLAGAAEWLTGKSAREDAHLSAKPIPG